MSKKIYSAQDWENVPSEIQQIHTPRIAPIYNKVAMKKSFLTITF